jgi:hypothetical protein
MSISAKGRARRNPPMGDCMRCGERKIIISYFANGEQVDICQGCYDKQESEFRSRKV